MLQKAKIIKVTTHNDTPKHNHVWMDNVEYHEDIIEIGKSVVMLCSDEMSLITTSPVVDIKENENNLTLTTENSIYYIKKFTEY